MQEASWSGLARDMNTKDKVVIYVASSGTGEIIKLVDQGDAGAQIAQKIPTGGVPSSLAFDEVGLATKHVFNGPLTSVIKLSNEDRCWYLTTKLSGSNGTLFFTDSGPMGDTSLSNPKVCAAGAGEAMTHLLPGKCFLCQLRRSALEASGSEKTRIAAAGIAVSPDGSCVYVAETMANRILRLRSKEACSRVMRRGSRWERSQCWMRKEA
eukprot:768111-Hanusia_phi.AAC.4